MWGRLCLIRMHLVCLFLLQLCLSQPASANYDYTNDDHLEPGSLYQCSYGIASTPIECIRIASQLNAVPGNTYSINWVDFPDTGSVFVYKDGQYRRAVGFIRIPDPDWEEPPECPDDGTLYSGDVFPSDGVNSGAFDADGCSLVPVYKPTYCDYPGAEDQECTKFDGYAYGNSDPEPPKPCYTESGKYIGEVSHNVNCPSSPETKCYNPDGTLAYIADSASDCPANTSPDNSPDAPEPTDPGDSGGDTGTGGDTGSGDGGDTGNGDGGDTGGTGDGSTGGNTGGSGTGDGSGGDTDPPGVTGGLTCDKEPECNGDPLTCYQIKQNWRNDCGKNEFLQGTNCGDKFLCQGNPTECYRIRLERDHYCSAAETVASFEPGKFQSDFESAVGLTESEMINEEGEIRGLWQSADLADSGLGDIDLSGGGSAGSCPAPIPMPFGAELSFQPLCDVAEIIRYLVIGGTALYCLFIINSGVLQGRRKS